MYINNLYFILLTILLTFSCSSKKDILYVQDIDLKSEILTNYKDYKIKVDDVLNISVISEASSSLDLFNSKLVSQSSNFNSNKESLLYNGYQVDTFGNINFPYLGEIFVKGMSVSQLRDYIFKELVAKEVLITPNVDVKLLNSHFTILGEIKNPGRHEFLKNNLNILEAIGIAGDLTINGVRDDIKLIRQGDGIANIYKIDLTSNKLIENDGFQIFSGDIILINPNSSRIKNAGIIGNSGNLISLLSFVLSTIILISR